jgi:predicted CxxxxCH...CXXCH cytochrome family protein
VVVNTLTCSAVDAVRPNSVGAHDTHIDNVGLTCNDCHYNGGTQAAAESPGHPESSPPDLTGITTTSLDIDVSETYALVASPVYDDGGNPELVEAPPPFKVCGNISCHYGETPDWAMRAQIQPDEVSLLNASDTSGGIVIVGSADNDMLSFDLQVTTNNDDGQATLSSVSVTFSGTTTSDVTRVGLWDSAGAVEHGFDTTWSGNVATITGLSNTITTGLTGFLIRYSIAGGAGNGNTVAAEVTGITFSSTDNLVAGVPTATGASSTVSTCTDPDPTTIVTTYPSDGGDIPESTDSFVAADITAGDGALYQYSVNSGAWTDAATPINMTAGGPHNLQTRALDPDCGDTYDSAVTTFNVASGGSPTVHTFHANPAAPGYDFGGGGGSYPATETACAANPTAMATVAKLTRDGGYECGTQNSYVQATAGGTGNWITFVTEYTYPVDTLIEPIYTAGTSHYAHNRSDTTGINVDIEIGEVDAFNGTFSPFFTNNVTFPVGNVATTWDHSAYSGTVGAGNRLALRYRIVTAQGEPDNRIFYGSASNKYEQFNVTETPQGGTPRNLVDMHINDSSAPDTADLGTDTVEINQSATYYADSEWDQAPISMNSSASATWNWVQNQSGGTIVNGEYTAGGTPGTDIITATLNAVTSTQLTITVTPPRSVQTMRINKTSSPDNASVTADSASPSGSITFYFDAEWDQAPIYTDESATATVNWVQNDSGASFTGGVYTAGGGTGQDIFTVTFNSVTSAQTTVDVSSLVPISVGSYGQTNGTASSANYTYGDIGAGAGSTGTGTLDSLDIYITSTPQVVKLFTMFIVGAGPNYEIRDIDTTVDLSGCGTNTWCNVALDTPLNVQTGDFLGFVGTGMLVGREDACGTYGYSASAADITGPVGTQMDLGTNTNTRCFMFRATGMGTPAPPGGTGGGTATACDTCHEFAPNDDILDASGHPDAAQINADFGYTPQNTAEYTYVQVDATPYPSGGDHIKHGVSDQGVPPSPTAAGNGGTCTPCHGSGVTSYNNQHTDGTVDMAAAGQINGTGTWQSGGRNCTNVDCHNSNPTPEWGVGETTCTSCHNRGITPGTGTIADAWPNTHEHSVHAGASNFGFACTRCHPDNTTGHEALDGNVNVNFAGNFVAGGSMDVNKQCSNTYCHGNAATPDWDAGTAGVACDSCHGTNGTSDGRPNTPASGGSHTTGSTAGASHSLVPCAACHPHNGGTGGQHVNGPADANGVAEINNGVGSITSYSYGGSVLGTDRGYYEYSGGTCTPNTGANPACHAPAADWGGTGGCTLCHGYPPTGAGTHAGGVDAVDHTPINTVPLLTSHGQCWYCHGMRDDGGGNEEYMGIAVLNGQDVYASGNHKNGSTTMNGDRQGDFGSVTDDARYAPADGWCNDAACHGGGAGDHQFTVGGTDTTELLELGPGLCSTCHNETDQAGGVWDTGTGAKTHTKNDAGITAECEGCHTSHSGGTVIIPNNVTVGIDYSSPGHSGIALGGSAAPGATEAEICWNCHNGAGISEWGTNTGTGSSYDYGTLFSGGPSWIGATWRSGQHSLAQASGGPFSYKEGVIQSTHAATTSTGAGTTTRDGVDDVAVIRCSYCHDVHGTHDGTGTDPGGVPYLRGSWLGNPYKEDGAPQSGVTYNDYGQANADDGSTSWWGEVPRASENTNQKMGGFWIDQNTTGAPVTENYSQFGGLCQLCHGADINSLNQYDAQGVGWVSGYNGHANSVKGGAGAGSGAEATARNIFDGRSGTTSGSNNPYMNYDGMIEPADINNNDYGFRGQRDIGYAPLMTGPTADPDRPWLYGMNQWGTEERGAQTQSNYHQFTCSKCHNPHASRLPKLMISNCLDTKQNSWDNGFQLNTIEVGSNSHNTSISQWTSAQNCHRLRGNDGYGGSSAFGDGWNTVTPW